MSTRRVSSDVSVALVWLLGLIYYIFVVYPRAFSFDLGDYAQYTENFAYFATLPLTNFGIVDFLTDDLLFYTVFVHGLGISDYGVALNIVIFSEALLLLNIFRVIKREKKLSSHWPNFLFLFVILYPKFFELVFFNIRQGTSFLILMSALYIWKNRISRVLGVGLALSFHLSSLLLLIFYFGGKISFRIKANSTYLVVFSLIFCAFLFSVYIVSDLRFGSGWQPRGLYTSFILCILTLMLGSLFSSESSIFTFPTLMLILFIFVGPVLDVPSYRFFPSCLFLFWMHIARLRRVSSFDLMPIFGIGALCLSANYLWI